MRTQNDQLDGLIALRLVASMRSFTRAAKELRLTPSAVSQIIKQLEERVGVALLARTTRSISLTEAGEQFLTEAGPAIDTILSAYEHVAGYASKAKGLLRINLPRSAYRSFVAPILKTFREKHPDVTVELYFEDAKADIVGSGFDAGIRLSDILAKDMVAIRLYGPIHFVIAGSPAYFVEMGRPVRPEDLLGHRCIIPRLGSGLYDNWEFEHKGKDFQVQVKPALIMNETSFQVDAAISGQGLIYTSEDSIQREVREGKLEVVLEKYKTNSAGYYLYYPERSQVLPKLRVFIEHVQSELRKT